MNLKRDACVNCKYWKNESKHEHWGACEALTELIGMDESYNIEQIDPQVKTLDIFYCAFYQKKENQND